MTPEEDEIFDYLVLAHNAFLKLPKLHPLDYRDFSDHIRFLQNIMLARVGTRVLGWTYDSNGKRIETERE